MSRRWSASNYERITGQKLPPVRADALTSPPRRKFHNVPTQGVNGLWFDSGQEARRAQELWLMEKAGMITELELDKRQLRYDLIVNGVKIATYVADFRYVENGVTIVEDVKGYRTPVYQLKARLMHALYGILIREPSM